MPACMVRIQVQKESYWDSSQDSHAGASTAHIIIQPPCLGLKYESNSVWLTDRLQCNLNTASIPASGVHRKLLFTRHGKDISDGHTMTLCNNGMEQVLNTAIILKRKLTTTPTALFYSDCRSIHGPQYCFSNSLAMVVTPLLRDVALTSNRALY